MVGTIDWWYTLGLSIAVGVLTGVTANLATHLFVNVWLPKYRDYVYRAMRVDGDWTIIQQDPADGEGLEKRWNLVATLTQSAYVVRGSAIAQREVDGESGEVIHYEVAGHVYDRLVTLSFRNRDAQRIARSTFLIEATGDGTRMVGYRSFYGLRKGTIRAVECTWRRRTGDCSAMVEKEECG
jgi:hypothetical protein